MMARESAQDIVERIETPALEVQTASIPVNPAGNHRRISREQVSLALKIWGRGDERFIPSFVDSRIVDEVGDEVIKEIRHHGKSKMADGSRNLQRTTFRGDNLMVTEYLAGPWFMAIAGIEERQGNEICLQLTTVRHKQHPDHVSHAQAVTWAGAGKPPLTTEQNARRVLGIIRELVENREL